MFSKMKSFLLVCSVQGEAHLTMPMGLLPLVLSEASPAPLPPAPLRTHWSASCASLALRQPDPPVKQISGSCRCALTEAIKPAQASAHQEAAVCASCSAPSTAGAQSRSCLVSRPSLALPVTHVRGCAANPELDRHHPVLY